MKLLVEVKDNPLGTKFCHPYCKLMSPKGYGVCTLNNEVLKYEVPMYTTEFLRTENCLSIEQGE